MELITCLECSKLYGTRKSLYQHVKVIHQMPFDDYNQKHGLTKTVCHCGAPLPEQRRAEHGGGRTRIHCSPECNALANHCIRTYGITVETYYEHARKGCAICGAPHSFGGKRKLAIDHDHVTGKFRGLLCNDCNSYRVGMNDLETATKVVEYLRR